MPVTVREMIGSLDYDDLLKIKHDLKNGGIHMGRLVDSKIKEHKLAHKQICSTCQNEINPYSTSNYTLLFGPEDFKKKASFCAIDCLEYFLKRLKENKGAKIEEKT